MRYVSMVALILLAAAAGWSAALPDDAALDKPVTLAAKGESLEDLIGMLCKQTGVRLLVDKRIVDQKTTIFVDDKPLREVMEGLSSLFGYFWSVKKYSTGTVYEIWQDEKSRQKLLEQQKKAVDAALKAALDDVRFKAEVAAKSPEARTALSTELREGPSKDTPETRAKLNAISQVDKNPILGICAGLLAGLSGKYSSSLRLGVTVRFDARSSEAEWTIPQSMRKTLADMLDSTNSQQGTVFSGPNISAGNLPPTNVDPDSVSLSFAIKIQGNTLQILGTVTGLATPPSQGNMVMMMMPRIRPVPISTQSIGTRLDPIQLPGGGDPAGLSRKAGITADDLRKEAEAYPLDTQGALLNRSDVLAILHRKLGLQVVSDHYSYWTKWPVSEDMSVLDILKLLKPGESSAVQTASQSSDWGYDGKFVYLRVRDMLSADSCEVPNRLLRQWASVYRDKGCLGLDEQADIAALSMDQTMNLRMYGTYLGIGDQISAGMPALRLYGMLTPSQRQQALAGGSSVDAFTPEQRQALIQVFFRSGNSFFFSTASTANVQVGIWTTDAPCIRLDKPGNSLDDSPNPEPPVMVAVRAGGPQLSADGGAITLPGGATVALPSGAKVTTSDVTVRSLPGRFAGPPMTTTMENTQYTMVFTFADGHTQQMGFGIPKAKSPEKPATGAGK